MIENVGRPPAHWPLCLVQAMDLHDDDGNIVVSVQLKPACNALIQPYVNYAVLNWERLQKLLFSLLWIYKTKLWNIWKHPTKALRMKCIYKITINNFFKVFTGEFMHSYENNQLPSHLPNFSSLFRLFINTPPDLQLQKISSYRG